MFAGIGSGVSGIVSSPVPGKRDEEAAPDSDAKPKGRRRKLKDDDKEDDSSGRATPSKTKRTKGHHHQ
jgi:hypothetical protein